MLSIRNKIDQVLLLKNKVATRAVAASLRLKLGEFSDFDREINAKLISGENESDEIYLEAEILEVKSNLETLGKEIRNHPRLQRLSLESSLITQRAKESRSRANVNGDAPSVSSEKTDFYGYDPVGGGGGESTEATVKNKTEDDYANDGDFLAQRDQVSSKAKHFNDETNASSSTRYESEETTTTTMVPATRIDLQIFPFLLNGYGTLWVEFTLNL